MRPNYSRDGARFGHPVKSGRQRLTIKKNATRLVHEWLISNSAALTNESDDLGFRFGFLLSFCPAKFHHLRNAFAGRWAHRTAFPAFAGT